MSNTKRNLFRYTPERDALLAELWPSDQPSSLIVEKWNALPGLPATYRQIARHAQRMGWFRSEEAKGTSIRTSMPAIAAGAELTDRAIEDTIRRASDAFGALRVLVTDHPGLSVSDLSVSDPPPVRYQSIMARPDPTRDARIAARAEMARLSRLGRVYDSGGVGT